MKRFYKNLLLLLIMLCSIIPANAITENKEAGDNKPVEQIQIEPDSAIQNNETEEGSSPDSNEFSKLSQDDEVNKDNVIDETLDNNEEEFKFFDTVWQESPKKEFKITDKILKSTITRTDIPTFLLKDDLTFKYESGPFSQLQFFGGYRGSINGIFSSGNYSTKYDNLTMETGFIGQFRNPDYGFKFSLKPIPVNGDNYIDQLLSDTYIISTRIPHHQITAGYTRIQTGIEGGASSFILPFAARSQIARNFGNARSLNVKLTGNYNYADYNISFGSSGRYVSNGMPGVEFVGQFNIKPFGSKDSKYGKLSIGAGLTAGHNRNNYTVGSFYIGYKHKRLWTNFEAAIADGYNGGSGLSTNRAHGFAYTIGWKFNPHLQLIGRIDQFNPDRSISHNSKREYTIGLNWFIKGQALKLLLNYVFCQNQGGPNSQRIILGTQIML